MLKLAFQSEIARNGLLPRVCSNIQVRYRRRTLTLPPWIAPKYRKVTKFIKPHEKEEFEKSGRFENLLDEKLDTSFFVKPKPVPEESFTWSENSKRFGLIARKIGMHPMWLNDGTRVLCTLLEIPENHVVSVTDPDTWFKTSLVGKRKAFNRRGARWRVTLGAIDINPTFLTPAYRQIFERANVPYKDKLACFDTTGDALIKPGAVLDVRHFQPGQFITATGKTIDWGFQGGMHRWGMRGMPKRGTTKSHRRIGSIGSTGDARVWPGKRMPGHMGYEWRVTSGLEVLRINPVKQVIYIKGCVPGDIGEILLLKDHLSDKKAVKNPPFPTYFLKEDDVKPMRGEVSIADVTKHDLYADSLFRFTSPSVVYTEQDETKSPARDKSRAKTAKIKK